MQVAKHEISDTEVAIKVINKKKVRASKMSTKVFFINNFLN